MARGPRVRAAATSRLSLCMPSQRSRGRFHDRTAHRVLDDPGPGAFIRRVGFDDVDLIFLWIHRLVLRPNAAEALHRSLTCARKPSAPECGRPMGACDGSPPPDRHRRTGAHGLLAGGLATCRGTSTRRRSTFSLPISDKCRRIRPSKVLPQHSTGLQQHSIGTAGIGGPSVLGGGQIPARERHGGNRSPWSWFSTVPGRSGSFPGAQQRLRGPER